MCNGRIGNEKKNNKRRETIDFIIVHVYIISIILYGFTCACVGYYACIRAAVAVTTSDVCLRRIDTYVCVYACVYGGARRVCCSVYVFTWFDPNGGEVGRLSVSLIRSFCFFSHSSSRIQV